MLNVQRLAPAPLWSQAGGHFRKAFAAPTSLGVLVVGPLCKASQMAFSEDLRQLSDRVRNWGRWGDDDERGTLNFLGPEATLRG